MDVKATDGRTIGTHLFEILDTQGIEQRWFARQLGVSDSVLSYLKGGRKMWTPELMERASEIVRLPVHIVFFARDSHTSETIQLMSASPTEEVA